MNQIIISKNLNIAFISAQWHSEIVDQARIGFHDELAIHQINKKQVRCFKVPGAFEIPLLAKKLAKTGKFDAIVAAGFVVDGGIYRHDFVAASVVDGLMRVQLEADVPVFSVVLTPHNFQESEAHISFFSRHFIDKGKEAARACLGIVAQPELLEVIS